MRALLTFLIIIALFPIVAHAQTQKEPTPPKALANMISKGSQVFYLGQYENMHGWALIRQGKPEFFYENKDRTAMVMGLLFNDAGEMISMAQTKELYDRIGDDMYAATGGAISNSNADQTSLPKQTVSPEVSNTPLTPAESMFTDLLAANWVTMNPEGKYDVFAFIDPDCPHCKTFLKEAQTFMTEGGLRARIIPVGIQESSMRKAALLLASSDPADRLTKYIQGDANALDAPETMNTTAVEKNLSTMIKHGFDVTPTLVYRTGKGEIRLIRGRPADINMVINDIDNN